jgi:hypothetical protein
MRRTPPLAFAVALFAVALLAWTGMARAGADRKDHAALRAAALAFLDSLSAPHRALAQLPFDDPGRLDWHFIPRERKGLPLGAMSDAEKTAAQALLHAGLSAQGYLKANGVMTLESVLQDEVRASGGDVSFRDPGHYYFTIFGEPRGDAPFLVRVEGHHLALNFTSAPEFGTSPTPLFFGANPACVRSGPHAGFRLLAGEEDMARALARSLGAEQKSKAWLADVAPPEVLFGPGKAADPPATAGIAYGDLDEAQRKLLLRLVNEFASSLEPDLARNEQLRLANAGVAAIRFAWAGGLEPGQGHYWRASGPTFVLEYDDTQDGANHSHALWRDPQNEFAAQWLAAHKREEAGAKDPGTPPGK